MGERWRGSRVEVEGRWGEVEWREVVLEVGERWRGGGGGGER